MTGSNQNPANGAGSYSIDVNAPAKVNLFLKVISRRPDGYHELRSLMCCIDLFDTLTLSLPADENTLECDHPDLPVDKTNLALKAALLFNRRLSEISQKTAHKVCLRLKKRIPLGAGLGGGSTDAAAVLKGLNRLYGYPFDRIQLLNMSLQLGADVPFFIDQKPAIAGGIGEKLTQFKGLNAFNVVLVYPGFAISTAQAFKNFNLGLTKDRKKTKKPFFESGKFDVNNHLYNDLELTVGKKYPIIGKMKRELLNQGAIGAVMSGSGSTVFGLYESLAAARNAKASLAKQQSWRIFAAKLLVND
ncbi:MAG: 4-(cytidine 5'-diphospho)-2-C-methyl-D-erythritol kinase [Desulfobacteraceae bacterium]|nr:4-(cytidine 5'-diphospho)-2-C-methyl-D-erythritol kinase [Desulfobacteraceae bacterium]